MGAAAVRGLDDLVGLAYEGIEEPTPWRTLMGELSHRSESHDASMVISSSVVPGAYLLVTDNDDPHLTGSEHVKGVMSVNVLLDLAQPEASTPEELMPDGAFIQTPLYLQFLKPYNLRYLLGRDVVRDDQLRVKLSLERTADQEPFSERERALLEAIAPHLEAIHAGPEGLVAAEAAAGQVPDRALRLQHGLAAGIHNLNGGLQGQALLTQVAAQGAGAQGLA